METKNKFLKIVKISSLCVMIIVVTLLFMSAFKVFASTEGNQVKENTISKIPVKVVTWAFVSAAGVVGIGSIGAGIAVAYVGSAAIGAIGEKPDLFGRALIFVALAEGIAIYGVIIAMMILGRLG